MPKRKLPGQQKKKPVSFSVEQSVAEAFQTICSDMGSNRSRELQKFIREFIQKNGKKDDENEK